MPTRTLSSILSLPSVRRILAIPFEDHELLGELRGSYPRASIVVIAKEDLSSKQLLRTLATMRKTRFDLAVASQQSRVIARSLSSLQLLLSFTRASLYTIRIRENSAAVYSFPSLVWKCYPRLVLGTALGLGFVMLMYFFLLVTRRHHGVPPPPAKEGKKTIMFLRTDLPGPVQSGGSITHLTGMIRAFYRSGFDVWYLADQPLTALPKEVHQSKVRPLPLLDFFDEFQLLAYHFQLLVQKKRILNTVKPDLIYQRHSIFNFDGPRLAKSAGIPCVLEANASEVWVKEHWSRLWFKHLARLCERRALTEAHLVSVISEGVRQQLQPYKIHPDVIAVNPNGVDPTEFHPGISGAKIRKRFGLSRTEIAVGFIGTFARWHGVETLFEAALLNAKNNTRIRFLLIGDGTLRPVLQRRAHELGVSNAILFPGLIPHKEAPSYLAACDILVSPHLGFEDATPFFGSPTKLFEYMAMGKAIIASKLEQIGDVIRHGRNGLHMKPGDARQLAELILKLAKSASLRARLGKAARRDVVARYTWDRNVHRILEALGFPHNGQ